MQQLDPASYDQWYDTPRGSWIARCESRLLLTLATVMDGSLLDIGAGTGHFSRMFSHHGLEVTALDPSAVMLNYARQRYSASYYVQARAEQLPFPSKSYDYCSAITSLCFVPKPEQALKEMWRVCRKGVLLGLLHHPSLLYLLKADTAGYAGARWDRYQDIQKWADNLMPPPKIRHGYAIHLPSGNSVARLLESIMPIHTPTGGFLAVYLENVASTK
ncbi:MAG: class I SAM-dependent methyltransferase [Gammaproteobacteria bacterium]|nr:class I SAM-dependent methyltransferase [Gammaproteobacteria bacterium]